MAKAILIMDMPESCSMCKFLYEFQGIKKCQLMNVLNNGASRLSQNTFTEKRHESAHSGNCRRKNITTTDMMSIRMDMMQVGMPA